MNANNREYLIITFSETTMALYMERRCKEDGMQGRIIPLPKSVNAGCGLVWASGKRDRTFWKKYLESCDIDYQDMMEVTV